MATYCSVYNPGSTAVTFQTTDDNGNVLFQTVPARTTTVVIDGPELRILIGNGTLYSPTCTGTSGGGSGGSGGSGSGSENPGDIVEDLVTLTASDIAAGSFSLSYQVDPDDFDSTEFVPVGGTQQVYQLDYTIKNIGTTGLVIFNSTVTDGPTNGLQNILSAGDTISFRYRRI